MLKPTTRESMRYEDISRVSREAAEAAFSQPDRLAVALTAVGLHESDRDWAEGFCLRCAGHADASVRGSTLLALGHLARRFEYLNRAQVEPVLIAGLRDWDASVRSRAEDAADDIKLFLKWSPVTTAE